MLRCTGPRNRGSQMESRGQQSQWQMAKARNEHIPNFACEESRDVKTNGAAQACQDRRDRRADARPTGSHSAAEAVDTAPGDLRGIKAPWCSGSRWWGATTNPWHSASVWWSMRRHGRKELYNFFEADRSDVGRHRCTIVDGRSRAAGNCLFFRDAVLRDPTSRASRARPSSTVASSRWPVGSRSSCPS